ncbi:hypothetical protein [Vibrio sp. HN007]|uniref:hypothetical protein n=1 Tax=Vibrio iocasae TaxID=3098914 RepID=UPI0035D41713
MKWDESSDSGTKLYQAEVSKLEEDITVKVWSQFLDVLSKQKLKKWDAVRIEFWSDSGRIIMFPAAASKEDRNEAFCLELYTREYYEFWEELCDSELEDEEFDNKVSIRINDLIRTFNLALTKAIGSRVGSDEFKDLMILYCDADEVVAKTKI